MVVIPAVNAILANVTRVILAIPVTVVIPGVNAILAIVTRGKYKILPNEVPVSSGTSFELYS